MAAYRPEPARTCVGCRQRADKRVLRRVVRTPDGRIEADVTGRAPGRGAYVHPSEDCIGKAVRGGSIARALRVPLGEREAGRLMEALRERGDER